MTNGMSHERASVEMLEEIKLFNLVPQKAIFLRGTSLIIGMLVPSIKLDFN